MPIFHRCSCSVCSSPNATVATSRANSDSDSCFVSGNQSTTTTNGAGNNHQDEDDAVAAAASSSNDSFFVSMDAVQDSEEHIYDSDRVKGSNTPSTRGQSGVSRFYIEPLEPLSKLHERTVSCNILVANSKSNSGTLSLFFEKTRFSFACVRVCVWFEIPKRTIVVIVSEQYLVSSIGGD